MPRNLSESGGTTPRMRGYNPKGCTNRQIPEKLMQYRRSALVPVAALAAALTIATPASAAWRGGHWHGGRGIGLGLGLATGAIVGSALAAPYYYGGYGYGPYTYGYGPYAYD